MIRDSVIAVPTCGGDLYVCRRQPGLLAFPGYHSFPGGKVDADESEAPFGHPLLDAHPPRLMRALVREFEEEVGYDIEAAAHAGNLRSLDLIGDSVTPPQGNRQRFHAHFFRVDFVERPRLTADASELAEGMWNRFEHWYRQDLRGGIICVAPTRYILQRLAEPPADGKALTFSLRARDGDDLHLFEMVRGLRLIAVPSHTLPPADETNAFLLGDDDAHRVLVDPSPRDEDAAARLRRAVDRAGALHEIFITHHHPDHRERANRLAHEWNVPLSMSVRTRELIEKRSGAQWFDGVPEVRIREDGEVLTHSLGEPVRMIAVPGHDAGQMALMPDSRAWCIVGDLIQGVGTVVVGGEEGDMQLYFESLQRIIDLDPAAIVPSHGTVMGTTFRLRETLKHRRLREEQVLGLHRQGLGLDDMLERMYQGTPAALLPLARINIESHLGKLDREGRLSA